MVWVETGLEPPKPEVFELAAKEGAKVVHVPALEVVNLELEFSLEGFDAAFVGSPRAATLVAQKLSDFEGEVFAAGSGTAAALARAGICASKVGGGNGAFEMLKELAAVSALPQKIAWLSAKETAVNLEELAKEFGLEISHFAVYETLASRGLGPELAGLPAPRKFLLRSGKAVHAVRAFLCAGDECVPFGKSAARALSEIRG